MNHILCPAIGEYLSSKLSKDVKAFILHKEDKRKLQENHGSQVTYLYMPQVISLLLLNLIGIRASANDKGKTCFSCQYCMEFKIKLQ